MSEHSMLVDGSAISAANSRAGPADPSREGNVAARDAQILSLLAAAGVG